MTRHLILGGGGFVGRHVAAYLTRSGASVVVAGRRPPPPLPAGPGAAPGRPLQFRPFDLADADWDAVIADCDVIHHYAWTSIPQTANDDPVGDLEQHVSSTLRLLEAARRVGGKRIVFTSSGGTVYGRIGARPASEDDPVRPVTAYGAAKLAAETYLRVYHVAGWADCRVARLSNPYGVGQDPSRNQGVVSTFVRHAMAGEPLSIWGDGEVVRDYVYVTDAAEALARLASHPAAGTSDLPIFNIGSGAGRSLNAVVQVIEAALGRSLTVARSPGRVFDVPVNVLDIGRARAELGWSPRLALEDGVRAMIGDIRAGATNYASL